MKSLKTIFVIISCAIFSNCALSAQYDLNEIYKQLGIDVNQSYTADMHISNVEGDDSGIVFKLSYKNGDIRIEGEQDKVKLITIIKAEGSIYSFDSNSNKWQNLKIQDVLKDKIAPEFKNTGTETLNGKQCNKFESFDKITGLKSLIWIYDGLIYKKVSLMGNETSEIVVYKNIEKKSLDDSLFIPEDIKNKKQTAKKSN